MEWRSAGRRSYNVADMAMQTRRRGLARGLPIVRKNTVRLSGDVAHRIRAGHPWVYREALGPRPIAPEPGTTIDLIDPDGEVVGRGLYDADSAIAAARRTARRAIARRRR